MAARGHCKQELTTRQAILKLTGVSHYVVQFECDKCIGVIPRKRLLDPPEPSVGDECRVEWSGEEYTAKVMAMGDDQQARKAEVELLKGLNQHCSSDDQPPAKKPRLLKRLTKKTAASKPKSKSKQKNSQPKAKRGKKSDFSLDLGSPAKEDSNQQPEISEQPQRPHADQNQRDNPERSEPPQSSHPERSEPPQNSHTERSEPPQSSNPERSEQSNKNDHGDQHQVSKPEQTENQQAGHQQGSEQALGHILDNQHADHQPSVTFDSSSSSSADDSDDVIISDLYPKKV